MELTSGLIVEMSVQSHHHVLIKHTWVNDVASLTENGTSKTLARVRASRVLPREIHKPFATPSEVIYAPEPVGPLNSLR